MAVAPTGAVCVAKDVLLGQPHTHIKKGFVSQNRFGCLNTSGLLAALFTLLVMGGYYVLQGGTMFSPGPLNAQIGEQTLGGVRSHAEIGGRCAACHGVPFFSPAMEERCLACHSEVAAQLPDPQTMHGALAAGQARFICRACHPEHRGPDSSPTVMDVTNFPHDTLGYSLLGHARLASGAPFTCADCHGGDVSQFDPAVCETCHRTSYPQPARRALDAVFMEAHRADFGLDCLSCHDGVDRFGDTFDHALLAYPLAGKHAAAPCSGCHSGARTLADLQAAPGECYDCHAADDPHLGQMGTECGVCHTPEDWEQATFDHSQAAFGLVGKHAEVACEDCHADQTFIGTPQDCFSCHAADDPHQGGLGTDCAACHTPEGWEQVTFDHSLVAFPLLGKHSETACQDCHVNQVFVGTPQDCFTCHQLDDAHEGRFGADCAACHTPEGWTPATFDHSLAAFQLTGQHLLVECAECHVDNVYQGTPLACAACHADPDYHLGLLGTDCAACHTADGWTPAAYDLAHLFPINHGESGPSSCRTCHPSSLAGYTCYGCHEHTQANIAGEHQEEGINDFANCVSCHPTGTEEGGGGDD